MTYAAAIQRASVRVRISRRVASAIHVWTVITVSTMLDACLPCDCDPGGSSDSVCDKATGKCQCAVNNVEDRTCSRGLLLWSWFIIIATCIRYELKRKDRRRIIN